MQSPKNRAALRRRVAVAALAATSVMRASPALALDEIYSPNVEYRELSIEYNGSRTFDKGADKDNDEDHEFAIEAGLTPRWEAEVSEGFSKSVGQSLKTEDIEIENRFQFFEAGENWIDSGFLVAYDFSTQSHQADSLETKLLLQKDVGRITNTTNIGFSQGVGQYSDHTGGADYVLLSNTRYRYSTEFQPGIELQSDFGHNRDLGHFDNQEHYIGPALYGKLLGHFNYQAAYLAGVSDAASQSAGRVLVEYELHF